MIEIQNWSKQVACRSQLIVAFLWLDLSLLAIGGVPGWRSGGLLSDETLLVTEVLGGCEGENAEARDGWVKDAVGGGLNVCSWELEGKGWDAEGWTGLGGCGTHGRGWREECDGEFPWSVPVINLGISVSLMISDDTMELTGISPLEVLQLGNSDMHAASTIFCSVTLRVFHRSSAESKLKACPGFSSICLTMELLQLRLWKSFMCSLMRTSYGLEVRP